MGNRTPKPIKYTDPQAIQDLPNRSRGEKYTRLILESLFKSRFDTVHPNYLRYQSRSLEIDLFNPQLRLGVEYQGEQHYQYVKFFHKSLEGFQEAMKRDLFKRKTCLEQSIHLIEVPDFVPPPELGNYILKILPHYLWKLTSKKRRRLLRKGKIVPLE